MPPDEQYNANFAHKIEALKKAKQAVILAHYYQEPAIQDIADFVGDSLGLAQQAAKTDAKIIVFAGVHFMAETAKILNPDKKVLLPDMAASCSLAESCHPTDFKSFIQQHPEHYVISYINCSAEVKAMSDVICTSSNAEKIIASIPRDQPIIFAPDKNLGQYLSQKLQREMLLWDGVCVVHEAFSIEKIERIQEKYPDALLIAHPESTPALLQMADFIGSTTALIQFIQNSEAQTFIVATEGGILHKIKEAASNKHVIPAPVSANNQCACSECPYMKMNTLEKLYECLEHEHPEIRLNHSISHKALRPIQRMLALS